MKTVSRREEKYLMTYIQARKMEDYIFNILQADAHNQPGGYRIRSLYFDTPYLRDYYQKVDSVEKRRKIRLRCYDLNSDCAILEMKQKDGASQLKRSVPIQREHAIEMSRGNYSSLLSYEEPFAAECYTILQMQAYRPSSIVEYRRSAYFARGNETRVTFDSRIEVTESCFDLFSEQLNTNPVIPADQILLEVKYNGVMYSYVNDAVASAGREKVTYSKYELSKRTSLGMRL